jgi:hypothetical protein
LSTRVRALLGKPAVARIPKSKIDRALVGWALTPALALRACVPDAGWSRLTVIHSGGALQDGGGGCWLARAIWLLGQGRRP